MPSPPIDPSLIKGRPGGGVVGFPVAAVEGGGVCNGPLLWAAGHGVVRDRPRDCSRFHVFDVVPFRAGEADPREALAARKNDPFVLVVPGVVFILPENGELDPVDSAEFIEGETQGHRRQDINLHERLPPLVIRPEGAVSLPFVGEAGEFIVVQAGIHLCPAVLPEGIVPAFLPELGIVSGEAVEQ